jgi:hypothetical protein
MPEVKIKENYTSNSFTSIKFTGSDYSILIEAVSRNNRKPKRREIYMYSTDADEAEQIGQLFLQSASRIRERKEKDRQWKRDQDFMKALRGK